MAQTIALQRGQSSITLDGTTEYNCFTQSGGTATRVIINGISVYSGNARPGFMIGLYVALSGGGYNTIAFKCVGNSTTVGSLDFVPGCINGNASSSGGAPSITGNAVFAGSLGGTYTANTAISSFTIQGSSTGTSGITSASIYESCPAQFWIGPSDRVFFRARTTNTTETGQFSYSFTTITES